VSAAVPAPGYDVARVRAEFPLLARPASGPPLAYLDSAASAQKPRAVIARVAHFYAHEYANIHRGVYALSETATRLHEEARGRVQRLLGAASPREIVFTRNATEAINLVAHCFGRLAVRSGDEVLITAMEHHANIVPWQVMCEERGARLRVAPIDDDGNLIPGELDRLVTERTRLVAVTHVSNVLGTVNPVAEIAALARRRGAAVLVDGAQAVPRMPVDVQALGCDFYVFSGHKLYGPTGIGVLWARAEHLEAMPPYQTGGDMIASVSFEKTTWNAIPHKFEAGTPDIAGAIGLGAAIDYVTGLGLEAIARHEDGLLRLALERLAEVPGLRVIGAPRRRVGVVSFVVEGIHPHDLGTILDREGVAIRAGHHCAQPLMERFGVPATARASFGLYNDEGDVERLIAGLRRAVEIFR
jgi:cysteine desulfurase/selenocysteine lyase